MYATLLQIQKLLSASNIFYVDDLKPLSNSSSIFHMLLKFKRNVNFFDFILTLKVKREWKNFNILGSLKKLLYFHSYENTNVASMIIR